MIIGYFPGCNYPCENELTRARRLNLIATEIFNQQIGHYDSKTLDWLRLWSFTCCYNNPYCNYIVNDESFAHGEMSEDHFGISRKRPHLGRGGNGGGLQRLLL